MVVSDQPGCWGAAARLPKNPGIQKLTPLSSALEMSGAEATAANIMALKMNPDLTVRVAAAFSLPRARLVIQFTAAPVLCASRLLPTSPFWADIELRSSQKVQSAMQIRQKSPPL